MAIDSTPGVGTTFTVRLPVGDLPATGRGAQPAS
jgi:signal transduction histidine kinase